MKEVFEKAILTYGQTAQEDVAIEEMSELIKAICKMRRAGVNEKPAATDAIVDEIADVSITVSYTHLDVYKRQVELARAEQLPANEQTASDEDCQNQQHPHQMRGFEAPAA